MSDLIDRLKARWVAECSATRPGASSDALDAFEERHGVILPPTLREYFEAVDGMVEDLDESTWVWDGEAYRFWPLSALVPIRAHGDANNAPASGLMAGEAFPAQAADWFPFADYLINSHAFAVRITADPGDGGPVCLWDLGDRGFAVAPTFEAFLKLYLDRSDDLYGSDAEIHFV